MNTKYCYGSYQVLSRVFNALHRSFGHNSELAITGFAHMYTNQRLLCPTPQQLVTIIALSGPL